MNIKTFKYTKANGAVSTRVVSILVSPNIMFEGIDITPLEPVEQAMYAVKMDEAYKVFLEAAALINDEFEMRNQYRRFDPAKMSGVVNEEI